MPALTNVLFTGTSKRGNVKQQTDKCNLVIFLSIIVAPRIELYSYAYGQTAWSQNNQ